MFSQKECHRSLSRCEVSMRVECGSNFLFPICFTLMGEQAAPHVYIRSLDFGGTQHALRLSMQGLGFEGHIEKIQIIRAGQHSVHRLCSAFVTVGSQEQAQMLARLLRGRYVPTISRHAVDAVVAEPRTGGFLLLPRCHRLGVLCSSLRHPQPSSARRSRSQRSRERP